MSYVEYEDVEVLRETDRALLLNIEGDEYWVPKSQISAYSETWHEGDFGVARINEWFASQGELP